MEVITPKPAPPLRAGRQKVFKCRCLEELRVWGEDVESEMIVFDTNQQQFLAWFVCVSCGQKTYLSPLSQQQLLEPDGPYIPYK